MPSVGMTQAKTATKTRRTTFDKKSEKASPGFYGVGLEGGIGVELTATEHVGLHRYTFPSKTDATVLIDIGHALPDVKIVDGEIAIDATKNEMSGFAHFTGGYSGSFVTLDESSTKFGDVLLSFAVIAAGTGLMWAQYFYRAGRT